MKEPVKMEVMSIVHGKSEYIICSSIKSNLRLKHEIVARDNGKTSIQITSVMDILNDRRFGTFNGFIRTFDDVDYKKGRLLNFSLFIIMDVDDCTEEQKTKFITKEMFRGHWLYEYIVPIYNEPNLEATMKEARIEVQQKKDYIIIFPTNHGDLDINVAKDFLDKIKSCECSNLNEYIEYCISIAERRV